MALLPDLYDITSHTISSDVYDYGVAPLLNDYDLFHQRYLNRSAYRRWLQRRVSYLSSAQAFEDALTHDDVDLLGAIINQESIGHITALMTPQTQFADLVNWYLPGKVLDYLVSSQNRDDDDNTPGVQIQHLLTEYPREVGYKLVLAAGKIDLAPSTENDRNDDSEQQVGGTVFVDYIRQLIKIPMFNHISLELLMGLEPTGFTQNNEDALLDLLAIFQAWQLPLSDDDIETLTWAMMETNRQRRQELGDGATGYATTWRGQRVPRHSVYTSTDFAAINNYSQ